MTREADDKHSPDGNFAQSEGEAQDKDTPQHPPPQFGIRGLLLLTAAVALLFGTLRWLGVSSEASALVLAVLVVAGMAAVALVVTILRE